MATRLQLISELSSSTYKKLSDYENWTAFLHSAAWQYKYPFPDQLMIYAQRPDARACAILLIQIKILSAAFRDYAETSIV